MENRTNLPLTTAPEALPKAWREPSWLSEWRAEEPVPVSSERITREMKLARSFLAPTDPKALAVQLVQTLDLYGLPENWGRIAKFYLEALADVPADLVAETMRTARMTLKWFPKPSELRDCIPEEARRRRLALARMRVALTNAKSEPIADRKPLTTEQQAALDDVKARLGSLPSMRRGRGEAPKGPIAPVATAPLPEIDDPRAQEWLDRMGAG